MGTVKKQKRARASALKNRYCAGAKLSEHKFLRIMRGFAEGMTLSALEPMTHVSGKTIRATYRALRLRLAEALSDQPLIFGEAGEYLQHCHADAFLAAIKSSIVFGRFRKRHGPRIKDTGDEQLLVVEFAVRVFCALDLRSVTIGPTDVLAAVQTAIRTIKPRDELQKVAEFIPGARPYIHANSRIFQDLRKHLLQQPYRANHLPSL